MPASQKPIQNETDIPWKADYGALSFVLKETNGNKWFKDVSARDMQVGNTMADIVFTSRAG